MADDLLSLLAHLNNKVNKNTASDLQATNVNIV